MTTSTIPGADISREINTQQQKGSPKNLMKKFISVNETQNRQPSIIDKPINLKNNETRRHIHRYDLRIGLKECRSEEEEQRLLQEILEDFLDTMLSADKHILVPPYYELDRSNLAFQDLSSTFKVSEVESFTKLKRYFSRLGNRNPTTGFVYCSCIIAASEPHAVIMTKVSQVLQESKLSLWPRSLDHENVGRIGWLLYSLQDMDVNRLKSLLTTLTGTEIGVKWMRITNDYSKKGPTMDEPTKTLVLEGPQDKIYELRESLSTWYGSKATSFPDAVRMRLIPPLDALSDANRQENYGAALAKQASFVAKMGKGSSWELTSNLTLDKKEPTSGISLRQLIMAIPSSLHPNYPLFHCVNRGWKEGSTVVFHFLPCNESEARMYISGLIAYLRATAAPWYLDLFKPTARSRSHGTTWDPTTKQITSLLDTNFTDTLLLDPLYDLSNSNAGLLSAYPSANYNPGNTSISFEVPITDGASMGFYKDGDSISTFRSIAKSVLKKRKEKTSVNTTPTATTTPTYSVSFAPAPFTPKADDTSISRMSDTASKVVGLETRFEKMETQFNTSLARLEAILSGINTQLPNSGSSNNNNPPVSLSANPPSSVYAGGINQINTASVGL
jgi:hypothetical protein